MTMNKFISIAIILASIRTLFALTPLEQNVSVGVFNEDESPSAVWVLKNKSDSPVKIIGMLRTCSCQRLEYENSEGEWETVSKVGTEVFPIVEAGDFLRIRVAIEPFGRIGPFSKRVYIRTVTLNDRTTTKTKNNHETIVLTVSGDSRPLVFASRTTPFLAGEIVAGIPSTYKIQLTPRDKNVILGVSRITNNADPITCSLDTNNTPWILSVTFTYPEGYKGTAGCNLTIPYIYPENYQDFRFSIDAKVVDSIVQKNDKLVNVEVFRSPGCRICSELEREYFDPMNLSPDVKVTYRNIDELESASLLMDYKERLNATLNEPVNVVINGKTCIEGGKNIRETFRNAISNSFVKSGTPILKVEQSPLFDLGELPASTSGFTCRFIIKNEGDGNLLIKSVRPTCDCVEAYISTSNIDAGGIGIVYLKIRTEEQLGKVRRNVYISGNNSESETILAVDMNVVNK